MFARRVSISVFATAAATLRSSQQRRCLATAAKPGVPGAQIDAHAFYARIRASLTTNQDELTATNQYYFEGGGGKMIRPTLLLHLARSLRDARDGAAGSRTRDARDGEGAGAPATPKSMSIEAAQERLVEIVEMIHTASLLHDDVIDSASLRRGRPTANAKFGTKNAILSGDYLLAQASVALADLGDISVIRLLSTVIKDLVEGEMMQMRATLSEQLSFEYYLQKSYLKTASLIAHSCEAIARLAGHPVAVQQACHLFGKYVGLAFQIIDDKLDFGVAGAEGTGKEVGADVRNGLITAPVLFAMEEDGQVRDLIGTALEGEGDCERLLELVRTNHAALSKTQALAESYLDKSIATLGPCLGPEGQISDPSFLRLLADITLRTK